MQGGGGFWGGSSGSTDRKNFCIIQVTGLVQDNCPRSLLMAISVYAEAI